MYASLKDSVIGSYLSISQPSPPRSHSLSSMKVEEISFHSQRRANIYAILAEARPFDVTGVLLRCLSSAPHKATSSSLYLHVSQTSSSTALIPPKATDLFVQIAQLQNHLKDKRPVYALDSHEDWAHLLCHGRQLLGYRIIIQLLLPAPERHLLLKLLSLLQKIAGHVEDSKMTSDGLARCLAVAVFGLPDNETTMGFYIDTLTNLIELAEELETLPAVVYKHIRGRLTSNVGRSTSRANVTFRENDDAVCGGSEVDQSAKKRSWTTCQVNVDLRAAQTASQVSITPLSWCLHLLLSQYLIYFCPISLQIHLGGTPGKDNRANLLSHLCLWSKSSSDDSGAFIPTPVTTYKRPRAPSPFLAWKKQRTAASPKKSTDSSTPSRWRRSKSSSYLRTH